MSTRKKRTRLSRTLRRIGWVLAFALILTPFAWLRFGAWGLGWTGWAVALAFGLVIAIVHDGESRIRIRPKSRSDLKYDD